MQEAWERGDWTRGQSGSRWIGAHDIIGVSWGFDWEKVGWMEIVLVVFNQHASLPCQVTWPVHFHKTPPRAGNVVLEHTFHLTWAIIRTQLHSRVASPIYSYHRLHLTPGSKGSWLPVSNEKCDVIRPYLVVVHFWPYCPFHRSKERVCVGNDECTFQMTRVVGGLEYQFIYNCLRWSGFNDAKNDAQRHVSPPKGRSPRFPLDAWLEAPNASWYPHHNG